MLPARPSAVLSLPAHPLAPPTNARTLLSSLPAPQQHIMIDLGTGNNNKINWAMSDKQEFVLSLPRWERVALQINNETWKVSGISQPLEQRDMVYYQPSFRLSVAASSTTKLKLVFDSQLQFMAPSTNILEVKPLELFYQNDQQRLLAQGLFLGVIIVMALYNLLIFWAVRDISFLWFVVSLVGIGAYFSFYYGFGIEYLWPAAPRWEMYCFAMIVPATNLSRLFFTQSYLHTKELLPNWNRWLSRLMMVEFGV